MKKQSIVSWVLGFLIITGFSLRAYHLTLQGNWNSDGLLYYELSRGLLENGRVLSEKSVRTIINQSNLEFYDNLFLQGKFGHILLILTAFLFGGIRWESVLGLNLLLGTATIYLTYVLGKIVFNRATGLVASALSAFSLIFITYSRSGLTSAGSMFFFTLGLIGFFRHIKTPEENSKQSFIHPLFLPGLAIGYAFTIHYNLAYYFLVVYLTHLALALSSKEYRMQKIRDNLLFAAGLSLPIMIFEFGYPVVYYLIFKKHVLYSYFQEVLYNALEAGGGSAVWNFFVKYISLAENPAYCVLVFLAGPAVLITAKNEKNLAGGSLVLFAFFPPILLSCLQFPLVGRNLSPSLPLFTVMVGFLIWQIAVRVAKQNTPWVAGGFVAALMGPGLFHLNALYQIHHPMLQAREDIHDRPVVLIGKEGLYKDAILFRISPTISVVPSIESLKKDPNSKNYILLADPDHNSNFSCSPSITYSVYDKNLFRPIRLEDRIKKKQSKKKTKPVLELYEVSECLPAEVPAQTGKRPVTEIGKNYNLAKVSWTSPSRMHFFTGLEYLRSGYDEEAIYEFGEALEENPNLTQAHNNLALALIRKTHFDEAFRHLNWAEQLAPGMLVTQNLYGLAYSSQGRFDLALQYFKRSTQIDPSHPAAYRYLVKIYGSILNDLPRAQAYANRLKGLPKNK